MWFYLLSIVEAYVALTEEGLQAGDIRPSLLKINDTNEIKLLVFTFLYLLKDSNTIPPALNAYQRFIQDNEKVYLAPETLELAQKRSTVSYDVGKADVFAFGVTMLQMCSLADTGKYYDYPNFQVKFDLIDQDIKIASLQFQPFLTKIIGFCLNPEPLERPSF